MSTIIRGIFIGTLILTCFFLIAPAGSQPGIEGGIAGAPGTPTMTPGIPTVLPMPVPTLAPNSQNFEYASSAGNYSRLLVYPQGLQFQMNPGDHQDLSCTITNKGTGTITIRPRLVENSGYGSNMMDFSWISISPAEFSLAPGERSKFTVTVTAPSDALRGYYSGQLALTDEQYPMPYASSVYPNYVNVVGISTVVTGPPPVGITPAIISDSLESGKSYDYDVTLENNLDHPLGIDPMITNQVYPVVMSSGPIMGVTIPDSVFSLSAPPEIPPGGKGTLHIHIDVPRDASGYYDGIISLGTDDSAVQGSEGMIQVSFVVWTQPKVPFIKSFSMDHDGPLTIELSTTKSAYTGIIGGTNYGRSTSDPSFDVTITGPAGIINPNPQKTVLKGGVSLTSMEPMAAGTSTGPYMESSIQYITVYSVPGKEGLWTMSVMPHNLAQFDYSITMGTSGDLTGEPATALNNQTNVTSRP